MGSSSAKRFRREDLHLILMRKVQPTTKPTEAQVAEKGTWSFGPPTTAATEGWSARAWPFTPRAEPAVSFGGPVAEEKLNRCYMFGMSDDEEPVEKTLMASSSAAFTSQYSVNNNLVTIMVDNGVPGHCFNDAIIRDLKHRLQDYVCLTTPRTVLTAGGALLDGTVEGVLKGLVTDNNGHQMLVRIDIVVVPGIGYNLFSVMTAAKNRIVTIFDHENPKLERFSVTMSLRIESGDLCSFVLDLSADGYDTMELVMNGVTNTQVCHRRLGHIYTQSVEILHKRDGTGITFEGVVSDCDVCAVGKAQQLTHLRTASRQPPFPAVLQGPHEALYASGHRRLQVR